MLKVEHINPTKYLELICELINLLKGLVEKGRRKSGKTLNQGMGVFNFPSCPFCLVWVDDHDHVTL